ncbi:hypothetical protein SAMN04487957_110112 [Halomonas shengliensis]|uniref:Uncharacterized protein n=1 Tax=Halomonas shengliensis TaxID=419597 RepID=A0A1H0LUT1_9GAMM|nr:hypothetical protein [Halomonas shengliensis]SDO71801.1 hypothetical protein SAMN04487957_110112 [Halomonas shengliensis]
MGALAQPTSNEIKREGLADVRRSGRTARQQLKILHTLFWHAVGEGATRQQLAEALEIPLSSICGRCSELLDLDLIEPIGTQGKPARQVLAISDKGSAWLVAQEHAQAEEVGP